MKKGSLSLFGDQNELSLRASNDGTRSQWNSAISSNSPFRDKSPSEDFKAFDRVECESMVKILSKRLKKSTQENNTLICELESQSGKMKSMIAKLEEQENEIYELNEKQVAYENIVTSYEKKIRTLKVQHANLLQENGNLKLVLKQSKENEESSSKKLKETESELVKATKECQDKNLKLKEIELILQSMKQSKESEEVLTKKLKSKESDLAKVTKDCTDMRDKITEMELKLKIFKLCKENEEILSKKLKFKHSELLKVMKDCQEKNDQVRKIEMKLQDDQRRYNRDIKKLKDANASLENQVKKFTKGFSLQKRLIQVLQKQKVHVEATKLLQYSEEEFLEMLTQS